ncbi:tldc domain-containing protein [Stylonychia lemnae]|uniref:Tldc domain-containing protein n=1 Tax=Stylonychia lemnae TaxID=5949 RepID=A0A078A994_STYLE|nr:tldc domain-containing protein [Stylonychia lemnae]|eukprot:CDW78416.1 tldc domain-containing protein [Stylonychia lemnae]
MQQQYIYQQLEIAQGLRRNKLQLLKKTDQDRKYEIIAKIGKGGQGLVHKASYIDKNNKEQLVALKQQELSKIATNEKDLNEQILRLAREISTFDLRHPNIVEVQDAFITFDSRLIIIITELADKDLKQYYEEQKNLSEEKSLSASKISFILLQILESLDYIHDLGIIHRDISPDNILVFQDKMAFKICDFGLATYGEYTVLAAGKEKYKAPEIIYKNPGYNNKADIWCLGIVLYYLITGEETYKNEAINYKIDNQKLFEEFKKLLQNPETEQYEKYQEELIIYRMQQFAEQQRQQAEEFKKYLQDQLKNNTYKFIYSDAIQKELKILKDEIVSFQLEVESQIEEEKAQQPIRGLDKSEQQERHSNNVIQEDKPLTEEQLILHQSNFRRLVDTHLKNNGILNQELPKLQGASKLLYKASRDGFRAKHFHEKCDNQGPTLTFIMSEMGQVFGGYTSLDWKSPENLYQQETDPKAYIFSLTQNTLHKQYQNNDYSICHLKHQHVQFGMTDIQIRDNCNEKKNSLSNIGSTYMPPEDIELGTTKCEKYLAGEEQFRVLDIEVYSVTVE